MALRIQTGSEPIPGYRLLERIGGGGFGEIWKCQTPDGFLRAIKIIHGDLAAARGRSAEQELHSLRHVATLHHPFLLALDQYTVIDGRLLIVMELADGSLWDRFRDCRTQGLPGIPRAELLRYLTDTADGLDALRDTQLQHLDVKPQNLLLVAGRCKVADFGLVRDLRGGKPGAGASPAYSAPETFAGHLTPHCDQYSLAVVYQELLTGSRPFADTSAEHLAHQHLTAVPNLTALPPADRTVMGRALAKKPTERFQSCVAFVRALSGVGWVEERSAEGPPVGFRLSSAGFRRSAVQHAPPALVIGVGGVGAMVLRQIRRLLIEQFGSSGHWPVRLLYIDTDPDATRAIVESGVFDPAEVLPTRLQRADHYAKPRPDGKTSGPVRWFDPAWLKRLSTGLSPQGCRGLGRLAFADHVRVLGQKIEADLATVTRARPGRPRVVIVAGLAGGTGGGMAIDLAFLTRPLLRQFGDAVNVAGWLLLPPADGDDQAVANAFAALAELRYFNKPDSTYRARCDDPADSLTTRDAPFSDFVVLPLDHTGINGAADGLMRELMMLVDLSATEPDECRTFGQTRFVYPRRAILRLAARQLAARLVEQWTSTNGKVAATARGWLHEQWTALELGPDALWRRLHQVGAAALGRPVTEAFVAEAGAANLLRTEALPEVFARQDDLIRRLETVYVAATDALVREWSTRLARPALALVEQPGFRLAAAEATVRQLAERIVGVLQTTDEGVHVCEAHAQTLRSTGTDPAEVLRTYPRWRHQALLMRRTKVVFAVLREHLAAQLREIELCRARLATVVGPLKIQEPIDGSPDDWLLPPHRTTLADAACGVAITADDLRDLDERVQYRLSEVAGGLARACLTSSDLPRLLEPLLLECAERMLEPRLSTTAAAEAFLGRHSGAEASAALKTAWTAAAPPFGPGTETTIAILPAPLDDFAREALGPDVNAIAAADEITIIRSVSRLSLSALPQLGPTAKAAYQRRKATGDSPHARLDVAAGSAG
jgi:hypothetical protein